MLLLLLINGYRQSRQYLPTILVVSDRKPDDPLLKEIIGDSQTKGFLGDLQIKHVTIADYEKKHSWPDTIIDHVLRRRVVAIACLTKKPFSELRGISSSLGIPLINLADTCIKTIEKAPPNEFHLVTDESRQLGSIGQKIQDIQKKHKHVKVHIYRDSKGIRDENEYPNEIRDYSNMTKILDGLKNCTWTARIDSRSFVQELKQLEDDDSFHILVILKKGDLLDQIIKNENYIHLNRWNIITTDYECESLRNLIAKDEKSRWDLDVLNATFMSLLRDQDESIKNEELIKKENSLKSAGHNDNSMWRQYSLLINLLHRLPSENFRTESFQYNFSRVQDNNGCYIFKSTNYLLSDDKIKDKPLSVTETEGSIAVNNMVKFYCLNNPM